MCNHKIFLIFNLCLWSNFTFAVYRCNEIGYGWVSETTGTAYPEGADPRPAHPNEVIVEQRDPFVADGFEIWDATKCFFRFQVPDSAAANINGATAARAVRVTDGQWTATPDQVRATIGSPNNNGKTNIKLWLTNAMSAFLYAGFLTDSNQGQDGTVQYQLAQRNTVISVIGPNAAQSLEKVEAAIKPESPHDDENDRRFEDAVDSATSIGIRGLKGTLNPATDYAYTAADNAARGLRVKYSKIAVPPKLVPFYSEKDTPYGLASKADGSCVVLDYRQMGTYLPKTQRQETRGTGTKYCSSNPPKLVRMFTKRWSDDEINDQDGLGKGPEDKSAGILCWIKSWSRYSMYMYDVFRRGL
ncbi:uncharacterized protein KY384_009238 [Bacidia gigantensis]|uniref:uncharacterized protein n=1 Tax=Bacidia gigantensis TaxID=2732470 RepID=UPI001D04CEC7|nr:uncharacterized protein KY384_009238 [Bacidia gigantensis]KAG8525594.1 hypothetical protein KY384_009238 [Bacidia gigantensis]